MRAEEKSAKEIYLEQLFPAEDELKIKSRQAAESFGLARISVGPVEGQLLSFLCRLVRAKKIVEIGTLSGLSAQYLLEAAAENSKVWTLEKDPAHASAASAVLGEKAKTVSKQVEVLVGDARETLPKLSSEGPFDLVFIDGNKAAYFDYWLWAKQNLRQGGLMIADNIFLSGAVWGDRSSGKFSDKQIQVMKNFNSAAISEWQGVVVPTEEGLLVAIKP